MPNWRMHFVANKTLKSYLGMLDHDMSDADFNQFCIGSIIPDIPWVLDVDKSDDIWDKASKLHFQEDIEDGVIVSMWKPFWEQYEDKIRTNPVYAGYLYHLILDNVVNTKFASRMLRYPGGFLVKGRDKSILKTNGLQGAYTLKRDDTLKFSSNFDINEIKHMGGMEYVEEFLKEYIQDSSIQIHAMINIINSIAMIKQDGIMLVFTKIDCEDMIRSAADIYISLLYENCKIIL